MVNLLCQNLLYRCNLSATSKWSIAIGDHFNESNMASEAPFNYCIFTISASKDSACALTINDATKSSDRQNRLGIVWFFILIRFVKFECKLIHRCAARMHSLKKRKIISFFFQNDNSCQCDRRWFVNPFLANTRCLWKLFGAKHPIFRPIRLPFPNLCC